MVEVVQMEVSDAIVIDWLMGARALGLAWANSLEDRRLEMECEQGGPVSFLEALACDLIETCDCAGTTYCMRRNDRR